MVYMRGASMRAILAVLLVGVVGTIANAGVNYPGPLLVVDDSSSSTIFTLGNSPNDSTAGASADFDTSSTYTSQFWDNLTMRVKSAPSARDYDATGAADSAAAVVVVQCSNDEVYWTPLDSLAVTDSLAGFKLVDLPNYNFTRFIVHHGAATDSAGALVELLIAPHGQK